MPILEKERGSEGLGWFVAVIGIIAVAQVSWNLFTLFLFLLAAMAGIASEMNVLSFLASLLGVVGGLSLLIGLVLLARHMAAKKPWLAMGAGILIAKNVIEALHGLTQFMSSGDKSTEALHLAAMTIGSQIGQLIFWSFVLWLAKTWVPHVMTVKQEKKTEAPRLQGAQ